MTYKLFDTLQEYNDFTLNGTHLTAGTLYLVKENKSLYFSTNNIDGEAEKYEYLDEIPEGYIKPEGNIIITENGEEIDIAQYATASVDVAPNLTTQNITENGTYEPSGDYDGFSSVTVNVAGSGDEALRDLIENDIVTLNIPSGTTSIRKYAFRECTSLATINIPDGVTSIGEGAFFSCTSLTSVTIPDGVTSIGENAFYSCTSLTSVTIPNTVTRIGNYAFDSCFRLTSVTVEATTPPTFGTNAFNNTNNCPIYVPAESVEAYKSATNWSSLASRIQAIS